MKFGGVTSAEVQDEGLQQDLYNCINSTKGGKRINKYMHIQRKNRHCSSINIVKVSKRK